MSFFFKRSYLACLTFVFIASAMPSSYIFAQDEADLNRENCPFKIGHSSFDNLNGFSCKKRGASSQRLGTSWLVTDTPNYVIWAMHQNAVKGKYLRFSGQPKADTKKYLRGFGYIRDNWRDIRALDRKNKTAFLASGEKVILYRIRLDKQDNCVGFSKGEGESVPIDGGGVGTNAMIASLVCDLTGTEDIDTLVEIIEEMTFEKLR